MLNARRRWRILSCILTAATLLDRITISQAYTDIYLQKRKKNVKMPASTFQKLLILEYDIPSLKLIKIKTVNCEKTFFFLFQKSVEEKQDALMTV